MSGGVFVGRHREMDQLKATFEEALGGHGKMAALVGEPGIGKTRTAQELATYASMRGGQVLWGRCYEGGGAPPYYPWVQAIRSYVMDRNAETIRQEMGSTASVIAEIVPDVKEQLPDLQPPPPADDPESARFRLFDSITTFLKSASASQPIVLMLEDLHWSDKPSLLLLEFVARELGNSRLMIMGNYRDMELNRRHPLSITLGELSRERLFDRVLLRGLQKHDVRRFIEVAGGIDPPGPLVDAVFTQTEGNPLFVTETVRLLIQEGDISSGAESRGGTSSWEIRIPEGVREVIGRRLDRLSERCNEVLTTAAVVGRQFRFDVLMGLVEDVSENVLLDVLDEALDARIVEEVPSEIGLYQFAHALMQETLTGELSLTRRVRLHARIAETLERSYGAAAYEYAAELAYHFGEAEAVLGSESLVRYSIVAGRQSLEALAHEVAVTHFQRAIDTMGSEPTDVAHALLIGQLGQAQAAMDRHDDAATNIELGFNYFADHGHTNEAVELMTYPYQTPVFFRLSQVVERALGIVPQHSVEAARMVTASVLTGTGLSRHTLPYQQIKTAVEIAREHGDLRLEMDAYAAEATIAGFVADYERSLDAARRALAIGGGIHNPGSRLRAMNWINLCAIGLGRSDETENTLEDFRSAAVELHERGWQVNAVYNALALSLAQGEYPRVVDLAGDGLDLSPGNPRILAPMAIAQYNLGELQTARETASALMAEIRRTNWDTIFASASFCRVYLSAQRNADPDELADEISEAAESASAFTDRDFSRLLWSGMLIPLVKILPGLRPDAATQEFYRSVKSVLNVWSAEPIDTEKAELALIRGDRGSALKYRTAALEFTRNSGYRGSQAWCSFDLAEMLLERDESGDTEKAIELQDEAIAIATELGMKPLLERVLAQREILKA